MILWFLRLFPQVRDLEMLAQMQAESAEQCRSFAEDVSNLEAARDALIQEKVLLEDRLSAALADKDRLWESMQRALDGERYALRTMVNHAVAKAGGGTPYQDAHTLPPSEVRQVQKAGPIGRSGRVLTSQIAMQESQRFVGELVDRMTQTQATEKVA